MYIWVACDLSEALDSVRHECLRINTNIRASEIAFTLPQHISLKISFPIDEDKYEAALTDIRDYFMETEPFHIGGPVTELEKNIIWLRFSDELPLVKIHSDLDGMLLRKYGVPKHKFDKCFAYHSTLFIDEDEEKLRLIYEKLGDIPLPDKIEINEFIIGVSESGKAGEYRVIDKIHAKM